MKTPSPTICPNCGHTAEAHYFDMDSDACGICDMCPGWFHNKSGRTTPAAPATNDCPECT